MAGHRWGALVHQRCDAKLLDITKRRELPPAALFISKTSLIDRPVDPLDRRPVDRRPVGRHPVFHARAADVHAPLSPDLAVVRLAGQGICPVHLDFVVCP